MKKYEILVKKNVDETIKILTKCKKNNEKLEFIGKM